MSLTQDVAAYCRVASQLQASMIGHNNALFYQTATPFGGIKVSGNSRPSGVEGFRKVTVLKIWCETKDPTQNAV